MHFLGGVSGDEGFVDLDAKTGTAGQGDAAVGVEFGAPGAACMTWAASKSLKFSWMIAFVVQALRCSAAAVETGPPTLWGARRI